MTSAALAYIEYGMKADHIASSVSLGEDVGFYPLRGTRTNQGQPGNALFLSRGPREGEQKAN